MSVFAPEKPQRSVYFLSPTHKSIPSSTATTCLVQQLLLLSIPMAVEPALPPTVPVTKEASQETPGHFILPDLPSHCSFPLVYHSNGDAIAAQSVKWLDVNCPMLNEKRRKALYGLQAGELTAYCYNSCPDERLRVVSDFMNYLFHL
jgi:alpha-muurolene/germacrene-A/gamma-muurolene synthase